MKHTYSSLQMTITKKREKKIKQQIAKSRTNKKSESRMNTSYHVHNTTFIHTALFL